MSRKHKKKSKKIQQELDKLDKSTPEDAAIYGGAAGGGNKIPSLGTRAAMLAALKAHGGIVTEAAKSAGISRAIHYVWLKDDADYADAVSEITEMTLDEAEQTLVSLMRYCEHPPTRMNSARAILQARGKSRGYGTENRKVEHSGEINATARVEITARLPDNGRGPIPNGDTPAISI